MSLSDKDINKWINIAESSLQSNDYYSANRELSGILIRVLLQEENLDYKIYVRKIISIIIKYKSLEVFYSVLTEALKLLKLKKKTETIETILFAGLEGLDKLNESYKQKLVFLNFASNYSVDFAVEEAEILSKTEILSIEQLDELFTMILPIVLRIETYETLKTILLSKALKSNSKFSCYHILIEVLLGANEEYLKEKLNEISDIDNENMIKTTIDIVNTIVDENSYEEPINIITKNGITDSNMILIVQKIQQLNY